MRKNSIVVLSSLLLVLILFVGGTVSQVFASGTDYGVENQQKSRYIDEYKRLFSEVPPKVYFYTSSDGYKGYLGRVNYYYDQALRLYVGEYSGYIYDRPPYPYPVGVFLEKQR